MGVHNEIDQRYLELIFRSSKHLPVLVSGIAPDLKNLQLRIDSEELRNPEMLLDEGHRLIQDSSGVGTDVGDFVAEEVSAITTQLEVIGGADFGYAELCSRLLGMTVEPVPESTIDALRATALELAVDVVGGTGPEVLREWEGRGLTGKEKVRTVTQLVDDARRICSSRFVNGPETGIEVVSSDDPVESIGAYYYGRRSSVLRVNPDLPRTNAALVFEVCHNTLPGDLFHLAAVEERWLVEDDLLLGGIKVKNTPDNVIAEGLEDLATVIMFDDVLTDDVALVLGLEELRRSASVNAALMLRQDAKPEAEVRAILSEDGLMTEGRVDQTIQLIRHPLWGTYVYTYVGGRNLVGPAWRSAKSNGREPEFFEWLYSSLLTPTLFGSQVDSVVANLEMVTPGD